MIIKRLKISLMILIPLAMFCDDVYKNAAVELSSEHRLQDKNIAVLPFETIGFQDKGYGNYIAEKLTHELVKTGRLKIAERSRINSILSEQELAGTGIIDQKSASRLGKLLAIDVIVIGTAKREGDKVEAIARVIDSTTGLIIKSVSWKYTDDSLQLKNISAAYKKFDKKSAEVSGKIEDEEKAEIELREVQEISKNRILYFIGLVENKGKSIVSKPVITFSLLDKDDNQIGLVKAFADRYLEPGEILPFRGIINPKPLNYKSYKIVYEPEVERFLHFVTSMKSSQEKFIRNQIITSYELTGMIRNENAFNVKFPSVIVSLFDESGKFVGSAQGFASIRNLGVNKSSPYNVSIYTFSLSGRPKTYKISFSGLRGE